jgi:HD-like signal output (HDOD) protein
LRSCEKSDLNELARIVEQDPSLAAQLISWACSPFYAYPGNIKSVNDAIINVLGFDLVLNIALGISVGQIIKVPHGGPLGLANYWRHAIYCAALSEKIIAKAKTAEKLNRGFAYLAGLLHNFGHLLLGQTFPPQFFLLNQSLLASPEANVLDVEYHLFGVTHADLGAWLMDSWDMPQELVAISLHHHDLAYKGEHSDYVKVVKLANLILKDMGIGDEVTSEVPAKLLDDLGLTSADITHITNEFNQHLAELDEITAVLTR